MEKELLPTGTWSPSLVKIGEGDAVSILQFHHSVVPRAQWLLRRYGALHPGRVARQLCHETVLEIQAGKILNERAAAAYLRSRIRAVCGSTPRHEFQVVPDIGACSSPEMELMIRYFVLRQSASEVCEHMEISSGDFHRMKVAAREAFQHSLTKGEAGRLTPSVLLAE